MWWEKMVPIESPSRMATEVTSAISWAHTPRSTSGTSISGSTVWT